MARNVYTVTLINAYIKNMFTQDYALSKISVKGEVSNCKYHQSGHIYFTLKDSGSAINCIMFATYSRVLDFKLESGQNVIVTGSVNIYERDGRYQLYANNIELDGLGDLYKRFEELKRNLQEMGMFSEEYKQPIPKFAKTIGVVTASTGAAIRDIMQISHRRNPYVQLILYPSLVQGEQAPKNIVKGIETLDKMGLDCLIVGRGGGSIEDLWAFNSEEVARAIFDCGTPIISAVGHEIDVTIADYVADMRAPTPSAAAELAVFDYVSFINQLNQYNQKLYRNLQQNIGEKSAILDQLALKLKLNHPKNKLSQERQYLQELADNLDSIMKNKVSDMRNQLFILSERLDGFSPLRRLSAGFVYAVNGEGKPVTTYKSVKKGDKIKLELIDGTLDTVVENISKK